MLQNAIELDQAIFTEDIKLESPSSITKNSQQIPCGVQIHEGIDLLKERSDLSTKQKAKFKAIVENYVKDVDEDKSNIQYEYKMMNQLPFMQEGYHTVNKKKSTRELKFC